VCIRPSAGCVYLVQGVYQTWCKVCIRTGAGYVSDLVRGVYRSRPDAVCVSDLVQGMFLVQGLHLCKRPCARFGHGAECAILHQNLVQGMLSTDTGCVLDLGCRYGVYIGPNGQHVSDQVPGVLYIRPTIV
jgi:hypothetical protein